MVISTVSSGTSDLQLARAPTRNAEQTTRGRRQRLDLILIVQAVLSYVPCQIWRFLNRRSGVHLSALMDAAHVSSEALTR